MSNYHSLNHTQRGFTIIELLIAMTVLSVILLLASIMMTNIGNLYYKGISQAHVQGAVRATIDEVSQHLQLTDSTPTIYTSGTTQAYCMGTTRYTYVLGKQLSPTLGIDKSQHVLWRDTIPANTCASPIPPLLPDLSATTPSSGGAELMAPRSRLTNFTISNTSPYTITITLAFGDTDLLCDSGTLGDCTSTNPSTKIWNDGSNTPPIGSVRCKGSQATSGQQFCGTAGLTTTVVRRIF